MLLLGAGPGEATCGILYLAGYLRRHGVEAVVRLHDGDETEEALVRSLSGLLSHVRPTLVGLSLKWFHHLARARTVARALRRIDPDVPIAVGGNTAAYYWQQLSSWDCLDHVVLGDGEVPLLSLARQDAAPPNVVSRGSDPPRKLLYVQGAASDDVHYSHFDQLFLSQLDMSCFSGWVAPGKGCGQSCLYCGGGRTTNETAFGRASPFLRPVASVRHDHAELAPRTWQLRYDFAGGGAEFLSACWAGVDLSRHATTYFLWGTPPAELVDALARTFARVFLVLDIGCFSQAQRRALMKQGVLKSCPSDAQLAQVIARCRRHPNLELEVSGIAGLPGASAATLDEERRLVERLLGEGCVVGYQRLEAQPGASVTEEPARYGMVSEASTFEQFLDFFERHDVAEGRVPMVRFADRKLEAAVHRTSEHLAAQVRERAERAQSVPLTARTRLRDATAARREVTLGDWLGRFQVPERLWPSTVTVLRSRDGHGLACAPALEARGFAHPSLVQGEDARVLLSMLEAFGEPTTVDAGVSQVVARSSLDRRSAHEAVEHLAEGRFLEPA